MRLNLTPTRPLTATFDILEARAKPSGASFVSRYPLRTKGVERTSGLHRRPVDEVSLATFRRKIETSCSRFESQLLRKTASSDGFEVDCGGRR